MSSGQRIISLLPSATEILFRVGAGENIVGVTHECDYPENVCSIRKCTASLLPPDLTAKEIDTAVSKAIKSDAHTIYGLNEEVIRDLKPTIIVTQSLCAVCAVPQSKVDSLACTFPDHCRVIASDPHTLEQLFNSVLEIGTAVERPQETKLVLQSLRSRLDQVRVNLLKLGDKQFKPRVIFLEWPDPPYAPGHWVPDQIIAAGGLVALGESGQRSKRVPWDELHSLQADVIVCAFCGYDLYENQRQVNLVSNTQQWSRFVKGKKIYATNASALYSRPGDRLVDGVELLAYILYGIEPYRPERGYGSLLNNSVWTDLTDI